MINELNHLNNANQSLQLLSENESVQNNSALQNKEVLLALSKIQLGEILSGKIILENDQTVLKLQSGLKLLAHLPDTIQSNQLLDFLVVGKGRQHLELEQVQLTQNQTNSLGNSIMKELQLPQNEQMQKIVGQWMDKQLPLVKNQMVQLYQVAKNYHLPSEALANLVTHEMSLSEEDASLVAQFKSNGLQMVDSLLQGGLDEMTKAQMIQFSESIGQKVATEDLKNVVKELVESFQDKSEVYVEENEQTFMAGSIQEKGAQGMQIEDSKWLETLEKIIQMKSSDMETKKNFTELLEQMLPLLSKEKLKTLSSTLLCKYLAVDPKSLEKNLQKEMAKLGETTQRVKEVLKDIEELAPKQREKSQFQTIEHMTQALDKYNQQGQYYCFPMHIQNEQTSGELYFFKPKKNKSGKQKEEGMYIVLALDMPSLKQIEVHLVQKGESLELKIKVAKSDVKKQMEDHIERLRELMDETMMPIEGIEIGLIEMPIHKKVTQKESGLNHLDFKI